MSSFKLAILISGSGSNLQAVMDAVENGIIKNTKVAIVISNRSGVYGLERAKIRGIPNTVVESSDKNKLLETLKDYNIDGIVLAGYLSILPPEIITTFNGKIINIHPALLPMFGGMGFYGIKVHQAVLASGVKYTGATAHLVDTGVDTGAALVRGVVPVLDGDTAEDLQKRVLEVEHKVLVLAVTALVENKIEKKTGNPEVIICDDDRDGINEYAQGLLELGTALTVKDDGEK